MNSTNLNRTRSILNSMSGMLTSLLLVLFLTGCSKSDEGGTNPPDTEEEITIIGISPESGPKETIVTIFGTHFGTDNNAVQVFFNNASAVVTNVSDNQITAEVSVGAGTGIVKVVVNGTEITGPQFTYNLTREVSTIAGSIFGYGDGVGLDAFFSSPFGVAVATDGTMYIADSGNDRIRKITPDGTVSTLAGSTAGYADGVGVNAQFASPYGITLSTSGNLYVSDSGNHKIRKITPDGTVTTVAGSTQGFQDGQGTIAKFDLPWGIAVDVLENLYVTDYRNHRIRRITPDGNVFSIAGSTQGYLDGGTQAAQFNHPTGLALDAEGNMYVGDTENNRIRKINLSTGVSTLAGTGTHGYADGAGNVARFASPIGVAVDVEGNVFVADALNYKIRRTTPDGTVSTWAGSTVGTADGTGTEAKFNYPGDVGVDANGNVYITDSNNHRIRKIILE